jgi:predicted nuclease with TOPRIM domain
MGEFPNEIIIEHGEKIAKLETDVENMKEKLDNMADIKEAVVETKTYIKILTKSQEEQSKNMIRITETLNKQNLTLEKQNLTLDKLNEKIDSTNERVGQLEDKFENVEEKFENSENKFMIDTRDIQKESTTEWIKKNKWQLTSGSVILFEIIKYLMTFLMVKPPTP